MTAPEPPQGVVLHLADGAEIAAEVGYVGVDADGIHRWEVANVAPASPVVRVTVKMLPAKTSVSVPLRYDLERPMHPGEESNL